jgi:hypothetical protein
LLLLDSIDRATLAALLRRYGLELMLLPPRDTIPGSFWGDSEAGLKDSRIFVRLDTPIHSILHEASHYICMTSQRRSGLDRDAGGDDSEEAAVCYLQVLLADELQEVGRERLCADMDNWGYSFRLGGARAWFEADAEDSRIWLLGQSVIDSCNRPTWRLRC